MSKTDFGKLMEEAMSNNREEQEQIAFQMFAEGGHSAKEIAEAMGTASLHEVSVLLEKYNDRRISQGKPPAVLGKDGKILQSSTMHTPVPIARSKSDDPSGMDVMLSDDDRALVDRIALQALTIAVADCDDGVRAARLWRRALINIDAWLAAMLPEIRKAPGAVNAWAQIAAAIAMNAADIAE